jgi:hypothetical protein
MGFFPSDIVSRHSFHNYQLSTCVENAYQAVAIDEHRLFFHPALWEKDQQNSQILEQAWFVGVHADIGGGYIPAGLSDLALQWIADKARNLGLGLAELELKPNFLQPCDHSRVGLYRLIPRYYRTIGAKVQTPGKETCESLHESVLERYEDDNSYRPKNLVAYFRHSALK